MTRIYLIRHGQTDWHSSGNVAGGADVALDENGIEQATRIANRLSTAGIDHLYSSPRSRCVDMAGKISEVTGLEVNVDDRLQEMGIGDWNDDLYYTVLQFGAELMKSDMVNIDSVAMPRGESFDTLLERMTRWAEEVAGLYPEGNIAAISHTGPICVLMAGAIGLPIYRALHLKVSLSSISILDYKGDASHLELLNDTCHLKAP